MNRMLMILALALPMAVQAEEVNDTIVNYNGKQIVISEDSVETRVAVYDKDGTSYKKSHETSFVGEQEIERFYVSSPFFNYGNTYRYMPTAPLASIGFIGTTGSALGFGSADGMPTKTLKSWESVWHFIDGGIWLNKRNTWSLSLSDEVTFSHYAFDKHSVLSKDADGRAFITAMPDGVKKNHLSAIGTRCKVMLKWYKYCKNPDNDRLSVGLGLAYDGHNIYENFSAYDHNGYTYAEAAGLKMAERLSLCGQFSYYGLIIYVQKSVTPLFKDGYGPKCYPFSLGMGFAF